MSSYEAWLQWMTTSSPGCHLVTPSPTLQTMPEASEPPMWWSSFGWERKTDTGLPSAAHTLLKFTPAAMTRTITSNAPGSGTSISSSWKASTGSPSRSWRMTQAVIFSGSVPGSTPTSATFVRSTLVMSEIGSSGRKSGTDPTLRGLARLRSDHDREIIRLAFPALGALAAEPLYLLTDTAIVGHLGTVELAALALAATLLSALVTLCNFLTYGTTARVARLRGAGSDLVAAGLHRRRR